MRRIWLLTPQTQSLISKVLPKFKILLLKYCNSITPKSRMLIFSMSNKALLYWIFGINWIKIIRWIVLLWLILKKRYFKVILYPLRWKKLKRQSLFPKNRLKIRQILLIISLHNHNRILIKAIMGLLINYYYLLLSPVV